MSCGILRSIWHRRYISMLPVHTRARNQTVPEGQTQEFVDLPPGIGGGDTLLLSYFWLAVDLVTYLKIHASTADDDQAGCGSGPTGDGDKDEARAVRHSSELFRAAGGPNQETWLIVMVMMVVMIMRVIVTPWSYESVVIVTMLLINDSLEHGDVVGEDVCNGVMIELMHDSLSHCLPALGLCCVLTRVRASTMLTTKECRPAVDSKRAILAWPSLGFVLRRQP